MTERPSVDPKSFELAEHFLSGGDHHDKIRKDLRMLDDRIERNESLPESVYLDANGDVRLKPGRKGVDDVLESPVPGRAGGEGAITPAGEGIDSTTAPPHSVVDVEPPRDPTDEERASVSVLARMVLALRREAINLTSRLSDVLDDLQRLEEQDLRVAMEKIDRDGFVLGDGTPVRLRTQLYSDAVKDPARLAWVEANGGAAIIKATITAEFDAEDLAEARSLLAELRDHRLANRMKRLVLAEQIHPQSMIGWCNDLIRQLKDPPLERLGVRRVTRAQVGDRRPRTVELKGLAER